MACQLIETAPKDGTIIIGVGSYAFEGEGSVWCFSIKFGVSHNGWLRDNNGTGFTVSCNPTHWMLLPKLNVPKLEGE